MDRELPPLRAMVREPFLRGVAIRNYKSIGQCNVSLDALTVLVGRNGSGKSNFLDALRFVSDSLRGSLDHAIKARGGIEAVRRRSTGHPHNLAIHLKLSLPDNRQASYSFEISARPGGSFTVKQEEASIYSPSLQKMAWFKRTESSVEGGATTSSARVNGNQLTFENGGQSTELRPIANLPPVVADRLYLVNAAGLPQYRPLYDGLSSMGFYNFNAAAMKELQSPDAGELLHGDGANIASVVGRLAVDSPQIKNRINSYLASIVSDICDVTREALGPRETLVFRQSVKGSQNPWRFYAASMSDGTLRALAAIVAVMQLADRTRPISVVGIEEPETALHPAATGALVDALREASVHTQIVLTTHSPEILDQFKEVDGGERILVVRSSEGVTSIAPVDAASREAIKSHLYSVGDLLRMDQLQQDAQDVLLQQKLSLFASIEEGP